MYRCKLWLDGQSVGEVGWSVGEKQVSVWAECPFEERFIYRAAVYGTDGERVSLGVMAPEQGRFLVRRTLPLHKAALLLHGASRTLHGEVTRTLPGERRTPPLPFAFAAMDPLPRRYGGDRDPLLCRCAQRDSHVRYKVHDGLEYLVFPLRTGGEMAFAPFFCLVSPVWLEGALYGVLCVDKEGEARRFAPSP